MTRLALIAMLALAACGADGPPVAANVSLSVVNDAAIDGFVAAS